ncbi:ATP-binding protein [Streptomyces sp. NRRL B-1347]|uniref:ATP-binding protein n=1 Tax=Streptomyces sp. NRRL B-1347 TaxID=1476877 RepID=UPI0004C838F8|nr:ATP-binding protein [Streptomyces sp. NRRL B-1347]
MNHATDLLDQGVGGSYRMSFTVGEHSARPLRRILRTYLGSWGLAGLADGAELALTELVANVVRHVPDRRCAVLIVRRPRGLRVEVMDGSPLLPAPADGPVGEPAEGGYGLRLVDAVTDRWDVTVLPGGAGKTIWFECDDGKDVDGDP